MTAKLSDTDREKIALLGKKLVATARGFAHPAVTGFDAFVDESLRIVAVRHSPGRYEAVSALGDYGAWVSAAAGRSGSREFVCESILPGGCSVNLADGLATLGLQVHAFSGVGTPPHPAFRNFIEKCASVDAVGMEPGRAIVTEFQDGKLMLCGFSHFAGFTPAHLREHLDTGKFRDACERSAGIALTSWSVYPHMTECWRHLCEVTLSGLPARPHFLFDLADPASRNAADIFGMARTLADFESIGRVTLSLNGNEAGQLARHLGLPASDPSDGNLPDLASALRDCLAVSEVCIHLIKGAACAAPDGAWTLPGPYCAHPMKSVGAGDRFNAGYLAGLMFGLPPGERLALGCACSGFFVRNARSGDVAEIARFLALWSDDALPAPRPTN